MFVPGGSIVWLAASLLVRGKPHPFILRCEFWSEVSRGCTLVESLHYVEQNSTLHLYGSTSIKLPDWFLQRFPSDYHQKRIFTESATVLLYVAPFENMADAPQTSAPERAFLELLSEVGCASLYMRCESSWRVPTRSEPMSSANCSRTAPT